MVEALKRVIGLSIYVGIWVDGRLWGRAIAEGKVLIMWIDDAFTRVIYFKVCIGMGESIGIRRIGAIALVRETWIRLKRTGVKLE